MHILISIFIILYFVLVLYFIIVFPFYLMIHCFQSHTLGKISKTFWLVLMFVFMSASPLYGLIASRKKIIVLLSILSLLTVFSFDRLTGWAKPRFTIESLKGVSNTQKKINQIKMPNLNGEDRTELKLTLQTIKKELEWKKISKERKQVYYGVYKILESFTEDGKITRTEFLVWTQYFKNRHFMLISTIFLDMCLIHLSAHKYFCG